MSPLFTIDFEASCLPQHGRSYPIEVGVAGPNGLSQSWLIRPVEAWRDWTWDPEAERLHGISQARLLNEGKPADEVLLQLAATLSGQAAIADSYLDDRWMRTLEQAVGAPPLVRIQHIQALIDGWDVSDAALVAALAETNALPLRQHSAGDDALRLRALALRLEAARAPEATRMPVAA